MLFSPLQGIGPASGITRDDREEVTIDSIQNTSNGQLRNTQAELSAAILTIQGIQHDVDDISNCEQRKTKIGFIGTILMILIT